PDSIWVNSITEQRKPYDIEWERIKIDVKTSRAGYMPNTFQFTTGKYGYKEIMYILVGLETDKTYFWVLKDFPGWSYCAKHKNAIPAGYLPEAVRQIAKTDN